LGKKSSSACTRGRTLPIRATCPFRRQLSVGLFYGIKLSN
jgi:hypothetical protein